MRDFIGAMIALLSGIDNEQNLIIGPEVRKVGEKLGKTWHVFSNFSAEKLPCFRGCFERYQAHSLKLAWNKKQAVP
jgi:hypothetical protein